MTIYAAPDFQPIRYYKKDECHPIIFNHPFDPVDITTARFCVADRREGTPFLIVSEVPAFVQFQFSGNSGTLQLVEADTTGIDPGKYVYDIVIETATVRCPVITGCFTLIGLVCP